MFARAEAVNDVPLTASPHVVETTATFPLSYGQRALWFLHRLAPASAAYNLVFAARLLSTIDVRRLRRALQALVDRHPCLRTTFAPRNDGSVYQDVHDQMEVSFEEIDLFDSKERRLVCRAD